MSVAFSPDGRYLASGAGKPTDYGGTDGELKIWDLQSGRNLLDLRGHLVVWAVAFSPDGRRLLSAGEDQTIKFWDTATGKEVVTLRGHLGKVRSLAFSPNGHQLVSASHDMTVRVWDATPFNGQTDPAYRTLRGHRGGVLGVAFSPDGRRLASGDSRDPNVMLWDADTWRVIHTFPQPQSNIYNAGVAFRPPDGMLLAAAATAANGERVIDLWDTETGHHIHQLRGHTWNIKGIAFDPTGKFLASVGTDSTVRIWNVCAGKEIITLQPRHEGRASSVAFSPDGKCLASGSLDRTVKIWSTANWKLLRAISDTHGGINSVAFAPDSRRVAWGGTDAAVKVADATTGQILETLRGHTGWVNGLAFSPDGRQIASASADGTVKIWKAVPATEPPSGEATNQNP